MRKREWVRAECRDPNLAPGKPDATPRDPKPLQVSLNSALPIAPGPSALLPTCTGQHGTLDQAGPHSNEQCSPLPDDPWVISCR
jgi:hypothetical protein